MADISIFDKIRTKSDYDRANEEFMMKKQLQQAQLQNQLSGGNSPAAIQIADEIAAARASGDVQRINDIVQSAKIFDRGVVTDQMGNPIAMGGYGEALGQIAAPRKAMETMAQKQVELQMNPQITGLEQQARISADLAGAGNKKARSAEGMISTIEEAEPLVKKATGSFIGAGLNLGKRVVGYSDEKTQANASLKALEGRLMLEMPRMEGPQSDKDTSLYRQMAAQIGDPTTPADDKLAALSTIKSINQKYIQSNQIPQVTMEELNSFPQGNAMPPQLPLSNYQRAEQEFNNRKATKKGPIDASEYFK
jgi:hypothetical protein